MFIPLKNGIFIGIDPYPTIASVNLISGLLGESSQWINWLVAPVSKSPMRAVPLLVGW